MAARIFDKPDFDVRPAGQPLIISIDDTSTTPDRYVVIVKRSTIMSGGTPTEVAKFYLTPNTNGVAFFDLSPIAESSLQFPTKDGTTVVHKIDDVSVMDQQSIYRFIVEVAEYNSGTEGSVDDSDTFFLTNGTEQLSDGLHPSFDDYLWGNDVGFLTERPVANDEITIIIRSDEERTVSLLAAQGMGRDLTGGDLLYSFVPKSGTTVSVAKSITFTTDVVTRMRHLPIGWPNIEDFQTTHGLADLDYVKIKTRTSTGVRQGPEFFIYFDDTRGCRNTATQVAWINTKGGWEYLRFDSRAPKQISVEGKTFRKTIGTYGDATFSFDPSGRQYETFAKTGKEQYTLEENFFDANQRALLDSLMKSRLVQIRRMDETVWKPVTVLTNSLTIQPAGSQFYNVSLQVEIAQDIRC